MPMNIFDFLKQLNGPLADDSTMAVLSGLATKFDELKSFERFDETVYQRNRILRTEWVDLLMLCWRPGQRTPIHDHTGSTCGVYVARGTATEIAFSRSDVNLLIPSQVHTLSAGQTTVSHDSDVHLVGNFASQTEDLVTLHCYSPPLSQMKVYGLSDTFLADYEEISSSAAVSGCYLSAA